MYITSDIYDISSRLREIDPNYKLRYNRASGKFELRGKNCELLLVYPYHQIDARMVTLARKTRVERSRALIEEMEKHNNKLVRARESELAENTLESLKEIAEKHYAEQGKKYY